MKESRTHQAYPAVGSSLVAVGIPAEGSPVVGNLVEDILVVGSLVVGDIGSRLVVGGIRHRATFGQWGSRIGRIDLLEGQGSRRVVVGYIGGRRIGCRIEEGEWVGLGLEGGRTL